MSYTTVEAALLTLVRAYNSGATFGTDNALRGDFRAIDAEGRDSAAVLIQGKPSKRSDRGPDGRGAHGKRQVEHHVDLYLFVKRSAAEGGDGAPYVALTTLTDAVVAYVEQYPRLNGTAGVRRAQVATIDPPMVAQNGFATWQRVEVVVAEEVDLGWLEQAQ